MSGSEEEGEKRQLAADDLLAYMTLPLTFYRAIINTETTTDTLPQTDHNASTVYALNSSTAEAWRALGC